MSLLIAKNINDFFLINILINVTVGVSKCYIFQNNQLCAIQNKHFLKTFDVTNSNSVDK